MLTWACVRGALAAMPRPATAVKARNFNPRIYSPLPIREEARQQSCALNDPCEKQKVTAFDERLLAERKVGATK
jgi:hypothetical protein